MIVELGDGYSSRSQIARRITEGWGAKSLFCAACDSDTLEPTTANTKAIDFRCPRCASGYQLKAGKQRIGARIPDGAYSAMTTAILSDNVPNLLVLQYTPAWQVRNLQLVPSFLFSASMIEKRKPLGPDARRAGWIGCNIHLAALPACARIPIVSDGIATSAKDSRAQYQKLRPFSFIPPLIRGWTLDVFRIVQSLGVPTFSLTDVYRHEHQLSVLHPQNKNVRPKIRQQLQVLRDVGFLNFNGDGQYTLVSNKR